jgi:chemotaxis protein methyltransferase CheR
MGAVAGSGGLRALSRVSGLELDAYRPTHVEERIRRAIAAEDVAGVDGLVRRLRQDRAARKRFRRSVAVSVSGLFRDPEQFELLERELLPGLLAGTRNLRVWSAGCADGLELYSIAIVLRRLGALEGARLLGSDLLERNVRTARDAHFPDVEIDEEIRRHARFERRDLIAEPLPDGTWHLIVCRNLAIYLSPPARDVLHRRLAEALAPGGVLLLGRSERIAHPRVLDLEPAGKSAYRRCA